MKKKTIEKVISLDGVGVHTGLNVKLLLHPSESGKIEFRNKEKGEERIELDPQKIEANFCSILAEGESKILTIEHLMAVFCVFGLDSVLIELDGGEVPIMDGSALPFAVAILEAGSVELKEERKRIKITKSLRIQEGEASVEAEPAEDFRISYRIFYDHPSILEQKISLAINPSNFIQDIAPARTFGFIDNVASLRARGLALGGSLDNAVVLDREGVINGPLRFPDEFVRHKVLDFIGDLAVFGAPLVGHFMGNMAGHKLHSAFVRFMLDRPDYWAQI